MIVYCCLYGRLHHYMWLLSVISAFIILVLLALAVRRAAAGQRRADLAWWSERVGTMTFLMGCLLFLLELWHLGTEGVVHNHLDNIRVALTLHEQAPQIAAFVAVSLVGNAVALILKGMNRGSFHRDREPHR